MSRGIDIIHRRRTHKLRLGGQRKISYISYAGRSAFGDKRHQAAAHHRYLDIYYNCSYNNDRKARTCQQKIDKQDSFLDSFKDGAEKQ